MTDKLNELEELRNGINELRKTCAGNYNLIKNLFDVVKQQQEEINILEEMVKLTSLT